MFVYLIFRVLKQINNFGKRKSMGKRELSQGADQVSVKRARQSVSGAEAKKLL